MNSLEDYPYLFSNGRFKARSGGVTFKIAGYHVSCGNWFISEHSGDHEVKDCTLIARPIESLTDEEIKDIRNCKHYSKTDCEQTRRFFIRRANTGKMRLDVAIKLADKSIYPFDQSHFENGIVIDVTKLKQTA